MARWKLPSGGGRSAERQMQAAEREKQTLQQRVSAAEREKQVAEEESPGTGGATPGSDGTCPSAGPGPLESKHRTVKSSSYRGHEGAVSQYASARTVNLPCGPGEFTRRAIMALMIDVGFR